MELQSKRNDDMFLPTTPWEYARPSLQDVYQLNRQQMAMSPQYTNDAQRPLHHRTQSGRADLIHQSGTPSAKFVQAVPSQLSNSSTTRAAFSTVTSVSALANQSVKLRPTTQPLLSRRPAGADEETRNDPSYQHKPMRRSRRYRVDGCEKYITNNGLCFSHGEDPSSVSLMDATAEGKQEVSIEHMAVEHDAHCHCAHELLSQTACAGHMEMEKGAPSKAAKKLRSSGLTTTAFTITVS